MPENGEEALEKCKCFNEKEKKSSYLTTQRKNSRKNII